MPYLRAPTYRVIRVIDSAGRWRPDFEGKKSCSREMEMDELEPAMEDVGMGWSRVTEQDGAVYYWHEASEQSRWEPPPHSTPNGCGGARLGHRMCEGCGAKQACFGTPTERKRRWCSGCGKEHGAVSLGARMCEGCGAKQASFGTPTERERRWCGECGKSHGAINLTARMCEASK